MQNRFLTKRILLNFIYGRFPFVRISRPFHSPTSHFENEIGYFQEFLLKNVFRRAYYLGFDWSSWRVLIKRKLIVIATEKVWPVNSDKWKAPIFIEISGGSKVAAATPPPPPPPHFFILVRNLVPNDSPGVERILSSTNSSYKRRDPRTEAKENA